jgi:hypothetical protein
MPDGPQSRSGQFVLEERKSLTTAGIGTPDHPTHSYSLSLSFFLNYKSFIFSFSTIIHKRATFISSRAIYQLLEPLLGGPEPPLVFNITMNN